jgi:adenylylsulfate kinase
MRRTFDPKRAFAEEPSRNGSPDLDHRLDESPAGYSLPGWSLATVPIPNFSLEVHFNLPNANSVERKGLVIWLTGLSSAGKSTIGKELLWRLQTSGHQAELLDGEMLRQGLCKDLSFSEADRNENVRRIGFVAELLVKHGIIAIVAVISPYRATRDEIRHLIEPFIEVYVNASIEICETRDVKGLYRQARLGQLRGFTGIDDPYEPPLAPEVECRTDSESIEECVQKILNKLGLYFRNDHD